MDRVMNPAVAMADTALARVVLVVPGLVRVAQDVPEGKAVAGVDCCLRYWMNQKIILMGTNVGKKGGCSDVRYEVWQQLEAQRASLTSRL